MGYFGVFWGIGGILGILVIPIFLIIGPSIFRYEIEERPNFHILAILVIFVIFDPFGGVLEISKSSILGVSKNDVLL